MFDSKSPKMQTVLIGGSVMRKRCGDEKLQKWLGESLAIMPDVIMKCTEGGKISQGS